MDFFNKVTRKISSGATVVANKTKDIAGTTKINFQISEDEKEIEDLFNKLGKKYYEENGKAVAPEYKEIVDQITGLYEKVDIAKAELQRLKGVTVCESCGAELPEGTKFCPKCGTKVIECVDPVEVVDEKLVCPACGNVEEKEVSFCSACGCKLK